MDPLSNSNRRLFPPTGLTTPNISSQGRRHSATVILSPQQNDVWLNNQTSEMDMFFPQNQSQPHQHHVLNISQKIYQNSNQTLISSIESVAIDWNFEDLEAVHDPYKTVIEFVFILSSVLGLLFNCLALVLINRSRHQLYYRRGQQRRPSSQSHRANQKISPNSTNQLALSHNQPALFRTAIISRQNSTKIITMTANKSDKTKSKRLTPTTTSTGCLAGTTQLRTYLFNLFVNDILIALFTTPFAYTDFMYGQWIYPPLLCPVTNFISTCAVSVSVYTLIVIGIERYFAIIHPLKKLDFFERHTRWVIVFIWAIGITLGLPTLIESRAVPFTFHDRQLLDCREMWEQEIGAKIYTGVLFAATFVIPFAALSFLYVSIAIKTFRHVIPGNANVSRDQIQMRNKIRIIYMLVLLVITFVICWLPIQSFNMVMWLCDRCRTSLTPFQVNLYVTVSLVCQWLSIAHTIVDPVIYCFNSRNFKIINDVWKCLLCRCFKRFNRSPSMTIGQQAGSCSPTNSFIDQNFHSSFNDSIGHNIGSHSSHQLSDEIAYPPKRLSSISRTNFGLTLPTSPSSTITTNNTPNFSKNLLNPKEMTECERMIYRPFGHSAQTLIEQKNNSKLDLNPDQASNIEHSGLVSIPTLNIEDGSSIDATTKTNQQMLPLPPDTTIMRMMMRLS